MPADTTETVAEHSARLQPSINLHAPVTASMFSCSGIKEPVPKKGKHRLAYCNRFSYPFDINRRQSPPQSYNYNILGLSHHPSILDLIIPASIM